MLGDFQPPQRQRLRRARTTGYLRSPYQRGGSLLGLVRSEAFLRDPSRLSPWMERRQQRGGALYRRRPTLTDKIAEGVAMGLSGPSPSFLKLGVFLGKQAVKGVRDNVRHARRV